MKRETQPYTPFTGQPCSCRRGIERDNCPACEGTGKRIDFAAIHARKAEPVLQSIAQGAIPPYLLNLLTPGKTVWTVFRHRSRSGVPYVLPMVFDVDETGREERYFLGKDVAEFCGFTWDSKHQAWRGNLGEPAGAVMVAQLGIRMYKSSTAFRHAEI